MNFRQKTTIYFILVFILLNFYPILAHSEDENVAKFPNRPITYIQPFTAGVPADLAIRLICKEAEKFLGQPIVVVNKPGAGGSVGVAAIAEGKPDGYTIGNTPQGPLIFGPLLEKLPYHPLRDLTMIMQFAGFNMGVLVKAGSPFQRFEDMLEFARQNPKKVTYGTTGPFSPQYIVMEQIAKREKVLLTHIPFKSMVEVQTALLGGHLYFGIGDFTYSLVESGQLRLLLLFREDVSAEYPKTRVLKDFGYGFPYPTLITVAGPKNLPDGIVKKLEAAFTRAIKEPAFTKGMREDLRLPIVYRNSKELSEYVGYNYNVFSDYLREMGLIK